MPDEPTNETTATALRERARAVGLELGDPEAHDLRPYYDQHQRWLATLRLILDEKEEPATAFRAEAGDVRG